MNGNPLNAYEHVIDAVTNRTIEAREDVYVAGPEDLVPLVLARFPQIVDTKVVDADQVSAVLVLSENVDEARVKYRNASCVAARTLSEQHAAARHRRAVIGEIVGLLATADAALRDTGVEARISTARGRDADGHRVWTAELTLIPCAAATSVEGEENNVSDNVVALIVAGYLARNSVSAEELPALFRSVAAAVASVGTLPVGAADVRALADTVAAAMTEHPTDAT